MDMSTIASAVLILDLADLLLYGTKIVDWSGDNALTTAVQFTIMC
jgi:hypothetical protein